MYTTIDYKPNLAAVMVDHPATVTARIRNAELSKLLQDLRGCAVSWWQIIGRYTYAFYGENKIARAAKLADYLRANGMTYAVMSWSGGAVAIKFVI